MNNIVDEMLHGVLKLVERDALANYDPYCEYSQGIFDTLSELRTRLNIPDKELEDLRAKTA